MKHKCDVCEEDFEDIDPNLQTCRQCQRIINKYNNGSKKRKTYPPSEVKWALRNAYSHKENDNVYFKCEYTGIISKFNDNSKTLGHFEEPFVLTLDHKYPNQKELVVCLNIINKMKGDIPPEQFKQIAILLGDFFKQETNKKIEPIKSQTLEMALKDICSLKK
ncbi:MAG: hypothetical protein JW705_06960 [Methanosarcinaceae archaeon]|nr:hypothetical protein [Methanosarcinaceae archaeon]